MQTEEIHRIWGENLKLDEFSDDDDFFTLGGHSLIMASIQSDIVGAIGVEVPMDQLFQHPTVNELSAWLVGNTVRT